MTSNRGSLTKKNNSRETRPRGVRRGPVHMVGPWKVGIAGASSESR